MDTVRTLLEECVSFDSVDNCGRDPLSYIIENVDNYHCADVAELLLVEGAPISSRDRDGKTPLMYFAEDYIYSTNTHVKHMVDMLLRAGVDLDSVDRDGRTALSYAAAQGNTEKVDFLLQLKASVNIVDNEGHTALAHALRRNRKHLAELEEFDGPFELWPSEVLRSLSIDSTYVPEDYQRTIGMLVEHGADMSIKGYENYDVADIQRFFESIQAMRAL